ncbi:MAG: Hpt domain-containing protein [Aquabacterium sp.]
MNQAELLDQFVLEARECLEAIGQRLLDVERQPGDAALLNDLFRSVHTLKGNCGLFEFKALERVVHAGEDLLDSIRQGHMAYTDQIADALLEAMDYTAELIDEIEREGRIAEAATARSMQLAAALRSLLAVEAVDAADTGDAQSASQATAAAGHAPAPTHAPSAAPDWLSRIPNAQAAHAGATALRYAPEPECFFKGEDPWRLVCTVPGLQALHIAHQGQGWPAAEARQAWDCYRCELDVVLISDAPRAYLEDHFRCVPEQVQWHDLSDVRAIAEPAAVNPVDAVIAARVADIWQAQCALLSRAAASPGAVQAASRGLMGLLQASGATVPDSVPADRLALLAWAQSAQPGHGRDAPVHRWR